MTDAPKTPPETREAETADAGPRKRSNWLLWLLLLLLVLLAAWYWFSQREAAPEPAAPPVEITSPAEEAAEADRVSRPERETREARPEARTETAPPTTTPATPLAGNPAPVYPPSALRVGQGGVVVLKVVVDEQGRAGDITFARRSSSRELDRAAREAVRQWRFTPAMRDGEPIASTVEVPVEFSPPQ